MASQRIGTSLIKSQNDSTSNTKEEIFVSVQANQRDEKKRTNKFAADIKRGSQCVCIEREQSWKEIIPIRRVTHVEKHEQ